MILTIFPDLAIRSRAFCCVILEVQLSSAWWFDDGNFAGDLGPIGFLEFFGIEGGLDRVASASGMAASNSRVPGCCLEKKPKTGKEGGIESMCSGGPG